MGETEQSKRRKSSVLSSPTRKQQLLRTQIKDSKTTVTPSRTERTINRKRPRAEDRTETDVVSLVSKQLIGFPIPPVNRAGKKHKTTSNWTQMAQLQDVIKNVAAGVPQERMLRSRSRALQTLTNGNSQELSSDPASSEYPNSN